MEKIDKVLLFYNPNAGNGLFKTHLDTIIERFQFHKMLIVPIRADRRDLLDKVFSNVEVNSYKKIIAAGGDGTINTVVNAMIKHDVHIPLAVMPSGTANDFAYYFDLPTDIDGMIDIATNDCYTESDVGIAGGKCFINVLAMGMLVDISQKTDPQLKNTLGILSYYLKGVSEIPNLKPINIKVTGDDIDLETKMLFMLVMNGRSAGGFKRIAPDAKINDGMLDVVIFKNVPFVELAPLFINVVSGQHPDNKNVISFQTKSLRIESKQKVVTDVDGETGDELPLDVSILPKRLKINTLTDNMCERVY